MEKCNEIQLPKSKMNLYNRKIQMIRPPQIELYEPIIKQNISAAVRNLHWSINILKGCTFVKLFEVLLFSNDNGFINKRDKMAQMKSSSLFARSPTSVVTKESSGVYALASSFFQPSKYCVSGKYTLLGLLFIFKDELNITSSRFIIRMIYFWFYILNFTS